MKQTFQNFDASEFLDNETMVAEYLSAALEDGNPDLFVAALGDVAKARGITNTNEAIGLMHTKFQKSKKRD